MSTTANLTNASTSFDTANDTIVIVKNLETVPGGRTLDVAAFTPDVIPAGHVIITDATGTTFKPMPVNAGATAYAALPAGHLYVGILISTILKSLPFAGIMIRGSVNQNAVAFPMTTIGAAFKTATNNLIRLTQD